MSNRTHAQLSTQSDADQINKYLIGTQANLTDALKKKLDRLQIAADMLRKHGSRMKVATILQNLWADCSRATSYRYIEEAQDVFAPQMMINREFYVDALMGMLFSTREKALAKQDLKTVASTEKSIMLAILKFFGDKETLPLDKLQAPSYTMGFNPELVAKPLPENYRELIEKMLATRRTGAAPDVSDAVVLADEPGASTAPADSEQLPTPSAEYE